MRNGRKVVGILVIAASLLTLIVGLKFHTSASGYRSSARTATGSRVAMYDKWAAESEQKRNYCILGGLAGLVAGGVLLTLARKPSIDSEQDPREN